MEYDLHSVNYAAYCQHSGDDAVDYWNQAEKVTDLECNWLVCWVQLGEVKLQCPVAKLRSSGSIPIKTLLGLCHKSLAKLECIIDLNDIAGTTNRRSAEAVLNYFLDDTSHWEICPCSGDLDLVDRLQIVHLQWLVNIRGIQLRLYLGRVLLDWR